MVKQHDTFELSPQDNPNLRTSADNTSVRREWTRRKFQFLARVKAVFIRPTAQWMRGAQRFCTVCTGDFTRFTGASISALLVW